MCHQGMSVGKSTTLTQPGCVMGYSKPRQCRYDDGYSFKHRIFIIYHSSKCYKKFRSDCSQRISPRIQFNQIIRSPALTQSSRNFLLAFLLIHVYAKPSVYLHNACNSATATTTFASIYTMCSVLYCFCFVHDRNIKNNY